MPKMPCGLHGGDEGDGMIETRNTIRQNIMAFMLSATVDEIRNEMDYRESLGRTYDCKVLQEILAERLREDAP
jgi:hypothetical protein